MTALTNGESLARRRERGRSAPKFIGEATAREERIDLDQRVERTFHPLAKGPHVIGQLPKNSQDFSRFLGFELPNAIAKLDRGRWLDKERILGRRLIVHDSTNRAARLTTHRNDVSSIANGDRHVGHALMRL